MASMVDTMASMLDESLVLQLLYAIVVLQVVLQGGQKIWM
jgi:hypothetical protein